MTEKIGEKIDDMDLKKYLAGQFYKQNYMIGPNLVAIRHGLHLRVDNRTNLRRTCEHASFSWLEMVAEMDAFLKMPGLRFLDVGAHEGVFTLAWLAKKGRKARVLSVEPHPKSVGRLIHNITLNKQMPRVALYTGALTNITTVLTCKGRLPMGDNTNVNHYQVGLQGVKQHRVNCTTGDDLCKIRRFKPDLIKIDVEGYEFPVLQGLYSTMKKHRPYVMVEIHPTRQQDRTVETPGIWKLAKETGHKVCLLNGKECKPSFVEERDRELEWVILIPKQS